MKINNIQVIKKVGKDDPLVLKAYEITRNFKVLPYPEVQKRLETKMSNCALTKSGKK